MQNQTLAQGVPRGFRWLVAAVALLASGSALLAAEIQEDEKEEAKLKNNSPLLRDNRAPVDVFRLADPRKRATLDSDPLGNWQDHLDRTIRRIYFPPSPPPLGVEVAFAAVDPRVGGPLELAPYVMELFYAPLSTRVVERSLTPRQDEALAGFTRRRAGAVADLRERLAELENLGPAARAEALEAFAAWQAPTLAALEREADELRTSLTDGPGEQARGSWYEWRGWKLGRGRLDRPREQTLFFEAQLLRAAAFYQDGLVPAQRLLLRECAIELEARVFRAARAADASVGEEWFWFSPHLARVDLPDDLPPELADTIARFRDRKETLKTELRDAIYHHDRAVFASSRRDALEELARAQQTRLTALEDAAEEIRRRLAREAPLAMPPMPAPLPAELAARIAAYERDQRELERELATDVARAVRHTRMPQSYDRYQPMIRWHAARLEAMDLARKKFRERHAARFAELEARLDAIRTDVEAWAGSTSATGARSARGTHGSFLADFFAGRNFQQAQHEYHRAVFEPGLAPAQRRLLFNAAVTAMGLPLPGPEDQPTALPGTLLR